MLYFASNGCPVYIRPRTARIPRVPTPIRITYNAIITGVLFTSTLGGPPIAGDEIRESQGGLKQPSKL
ncbi:hypothetical protein V9T40_014948 [Parthenolecanium corni]|uniref:Uncharacterized protein n=1 Tax=Parthenolecanium corni TaxID=536013 RepID=A0AAN9TP45_9HEMI